MRIITIKREDPLNYIQGNLNYFMAKMNAFTPYINIDDFVLEQALLRAYLCSDCLVNGRCVVCKCSTPSMFFSPNKVDSKGKWKAMVTKKEWEKEKEESQSWKEFVEHIRNQVVPKPEDLSKDTLEKELNEEDDQFIKDIHKILDIISRTKQSSTDDNPVSDKEPEQSPEGKNE